MALLKSTAATEKIVGLIRQTFHWWAEASLALIATAAGQRVEEKKWRNLIDSSSAGSNWKRRAEDEAVQWAWPTAASPRRKEKVRRERVPRSIMIIGVRQLISQAWPNMQILTHPVELTDGDNVAVWLFHRIIHFSTWGCVNSSEYLSPQRRLSLTFISGNFRLIFKIRKFW